MYEWLQQFMDPANTDQIAGLLAQKSAPPPEALAFAQQAQGQGQGQGQGPQALAYRPGILPQGQGPQALPQGFAYAINPQGPNANGLLPEPQANFGPDFDAASGRVPQPPAPVPSARPQLTPEQFAQLAQLTSGNPQRVAQAPGTPGVLGGHGVSAPQMLQVASPAQRLTLAQLLAGRR